MSQSKRYKIVFLSLLLLHKAKQLWRSLLLGILSGCSFIHKRKQRALSFSQSGPSVDKQGRGLRHTGEFRRRTRKRPDNMAANCRDQRGVSEGGAKMWIIKHVSVSHGAGWGCGSTAVDGWQLGWRCGPFLTLQALIRATTNILLSYG